jgi:hypothetical protein
MGVGGQSHVPAALLRERPGTLDVGGGWVPGPVWTGADPPVVKRYTEWAIPAYMDFMYKIW